jgi:hypothetical protein
MIFVVERDELHGLPGPFYRVRNIGALIVRLSWVVAALSQRSESK